MTPRERQQQALATLEAAGIELQNSKPDHMPRRWFAGPTSPTIHGTDQLETVAHYAALAYQAGKEATVDRLMEHERQTRSSR